MPRLLLIACLFHGFVILSCSEKKLAEKPLFRQLPASETGVDFVNRNEDTDSLNILDYLYYYNGAGVAVGDINNDSLPDMYFASNQNGNTLYLNKGGFKFEDITQKAGVKGTGEWTTGVTMADVNADGWLDIYVCTVANHTPMSGDNKGTHTYFTHTKNQLLINNRNGSFTDSAREYGLDLAGYSTQAAFFDYDKDGDLDMFLLQHSIHRTETYGDTSLRSTYSDISGNKLFRNDGPVLTPVAGVRKGGFTNVTKGSGLLSSALGYGLGVAISDFNNDGWEDIYVGNDFHENDYYYLGSAAGIFREMNRAAFGHQSNFSMGNDAADLNHDGWMDIVTLDMLPEDEHAIKTTLGDEDFDVYEQLHKMGYHHQYSRNCLQLNMGHGQRFAEMGLYSGVAATDWSWSVLANDFDDDGNNDLFITNGIKHRLNDLDYIKFLSEETLKANIAGKKNDKELLAKMPDGKWHNYFLKGSDSLQFEDKSTVWGFETPNLSNGAAYADLDRDGDLDLITNNINEAAGVYQNNTVHDTAAASLNIYFEGMGANTKGIGTRAVVFAGGKIFYQLLQPSRGFMSSSEPMLHFGLGKINKIDSLVIVWVDGNAETINNVVVNSTLNMKQLKGQAQKKVDFLNYFRMLMAGPGQRVSEEQNDLYKDFSFEIAWKHKENLSYNDFARNPFIPHQLSTFGPKVAVADVNGDGLDDFYVGGAKAQPGALFIQTGDAKFVLSNQPGISADSISEDVDAVFFDADGDKDQDLYVSSGGNEFYGEAPQLADRLYLNDGKGNFVKSQGLPALYENKSCVRPCDYDRDGDIDLFVGSRANSMVYGEIPSSYLLTNDGRGKFTITTKTLAPDLEKAGLISDAQWTDVNGDGYEDLVVVGEWIAPTFFINNKGKLAKDEAFNKPYTKLTGWWQSVYVADVNNDSIPDILLGNYGLNSKIKASEDHPLKMYLKDIDNNQYPDQVLSVYHGGNYFPFLGKEALEKHLPYLKKEFLSYQKMAGKTTDEIFMGKLDGATVFETNTLASMVLMGDGKGGYMPRMLPLQMQLAPIFTWFGTKGDKPTGNSTWIIAGGGFYGVSPYEGRYDAMEAVTLFSDSKNATFSALPINPNLWGEIRDIKPIRIAKQATALIVARNNKPLQIVTERTMGALILMPQGK
ncbi:MAG: FG-GAP-like repeat-containing protein [Bacteroidota bacterium]